MKNLPKWGFWGILGGGVKIFGGNPPTNAMTADLRRLVKNDGDAPNSLVCTLGKEITKKHKKRNVYAVRVTFHPCAALTPLKPLVTPWCMWGPMVDVITHALFQLNRFRG